MVFIQNTYVGHNFPKDPFMTHCSNKNTQIIIPQNQEYKQQQTYKNDSSKNGCTDV